jgi:hypothetical protein
MKAGFLLGDHLLHTSAVVIAAAGSTLPTLSRSAAHHLAIWGQKHSESIENRQLART